MIYNPRTTHISPQFHVVHDDQFTTVTNASSTFTDQFLERLYNNQKWFHNDSFADMMDLHYFETYWADPPTSKLEHRKSKKLKSNGTSPFGETSLSNACITSHNTSEPAVHSDHATSSEQATVNNLSNFSEPAISSYINISCSSETAKTSEPAHYNLNLLLDQTTGPISNTHSIQTETPTLQEAQKVRANLVPAQCSALFTQIKALLGIQADVYTAISDSSLPTDNILQPNDPVLDNTPISLLTYDTADLANTDTPTESTTCNNKEDILTQSQMFKANDSTEFIACQRDEIKGLQKFDVMDIEHISQLSAKAKLLSSIWSYRRKRLPNGVLLKYKSRICVNGKEQAFGRDYWETYAPVASWSTIRLMIILSTLMNLKTRQVDYTQAFPQAALTEPVFMKIPQGWYINDKGELTQHDDPKFNDTTHYFKLKRNLYGCKQAARNWFKHLTNGLLNQGFTQSKTDCCLFLRHDCILVVYVDDCLIFARSDDTISSLIQSLSSTFLLQDEGDVSAFLGVQIAKNPLTKTITLTQPGLIQQIINDVGITKFAKGKDTPVDSILHSDPNGASRTETWNYRSIIGKLNYIANNTGPDISMAVHQCAKYCSQPKAIHELAVKRIVRYLLSTKDKGLILKPNTSLTLDMYVDADFAGMWHKEYAELRENVLSRTGFAILFCGCPIMWCSKLQTEIALSTTESEYIALSTATRHLLPLRRILEDINESSFISLTKHSKTSGSATTLLPSNIFEDNAACIVLATNESNYKPRTKHISLKYHHFHDQIQNGNLQMIKVDTHNNLADIFTKPLNKLKFQYLRKGLMGW